MTGAEALYADLGHFGRRPIQAAWYRVVFPALDAQLFRPGRARPHAIPRRARTRSSCSFPEWALIPVVILATAATVIASQAVISGAYSLTRQAIQLGLLPRMRILFTSETTTGQIYMPRINWLLFAAVVVLTLLFGSSANLAVGLRHRGHRDDGRGRAARHHRAALLLALAAAGPRSRRSARSCSSRSTFLAANSLKIAQRRLGADPASAARWCSSC